MNVFEMVSTQAQALLSEWIKIGDPKNRLTIEDFPEETGVDETKTNGHCWKCVSINQCWFKNENNKKPEEFDYAKYSFGEIPLSKRGLYHPNCHDKKASINVPRLEQIEILKQRSKFNDFFKRKSDIFYSIRYTYKDENEIIEIYQNQIKKQYRYGNYTVCKHWKYGFQINIPIIVEGKAGFKNFCYRFNSGITILPNGKLKVVTILAGRTNL